MEDRLVRGFYLSRINNLNCPIAVCQDCHKRIEDAGLGIVLWNVEDVECVIAHKTCDINKKDTYEMSECLSSFYWNLLYNSGIKNPKKDLKEPLQIC